MPPTRRTSRERKRVSCAKKPLVSVGDVAAVVADAERRSLEDREHLASSSRRTIRPPLDWARALITISSTLTCSGRVTAKRTQSATSSGGQRVDAVVTAPRRLVVALEADERELGLDEARVDRRDPDRAPEQVLAQPVDEAAQPNFAATYEAAFWYACRPGDRAREQDVAPVADVREASRVIRITPSTFVCRTVASSSGFDSVNG